MDALRRGDVVAVAGGGAYVRKPRPAVVVQSDLFNDTHASITLIPLTTTLVQAPLFRIPVAPSRTNGLRARSHAMVDKVTSVPRERVGARLGVVASPDMERIEGAMLLWLGLQP
jgi:mRNA interferase MazF